MSPEQRRRSFEVFLQSHICLFKAVIIPQAEYIHIFKDIFAHTVRYCAGKTSREYRNTRAKFKLG